MNCSMVFLCLIYTSFFVCIALGVEINTCHWGHDCCINCSNSNSLDVLTNIGILMEDDVFCKRLALFITDIRFPDNIMNGNWFDGPEFVKRLDIINSNISIIESDAFRGFKKVTQLQLINIPLDKIETGAFNELIFLEILHLTGLKLKRFEPLILQPCSNLKYFSLEGLDDKSDPIIIDGLTGTGNIASLTEVFITDNNICDTITQKTFVGLTAVSTLFLLRNNIVSIGTDAFKPISKTLMYLNLEYNHLRVLSSNIFFPLLVNANINYKTILLANNLWHCDCKLIPLKGLMKINSRAFSDDPKCSSPGNFREQSIRESTFCSNPTNTTDSTPSPSEQNVYLKCNQYDNSSVALLKGSPARIRIYKFNDKITITIENYNRQSVLVVFESMQFGVLKTVNCFKLYENTGYKIKMTLEMETEYQKTYMICLMNTISNTISPFDCFSYSTYAEDGDDMKLTWLPQRLTYTIIVSFIIAICSALIFGIVIVYVTMKNCPSIRNRFRGREVSGTNQIDKIELKKTCQQPQKKISCKSTENCQNLDVLCRHDYVNGKSQTKQYNLYTKVLPEVPPLHPSADKHDNIYCELE